MISLNLSNPNQKPLIETYADANQTTAKKSKKDSTPTRANRSQSTGPVETVMPGQKNDPLFSDTENQTETPAITLDPKDPFEVDHEAPLKIDGISDHISHDSVFGIKCSVCDTHIHVTPDQIGSHIECPECFTTLLVKRPQASKKKANSRWRQHQPEKSHLLPDDELALSDPVERPRIDYNIDPSFGLEEVTDDLLTPRQSAEDPEEQPETKQVESGTKGIDPAPSAGAQIKSKKSRRERLEAAQQRQLEKEKSRPRIPANAEAAAQAGQGIKDSIQFPDFNLGSLVKAIKNMFGSPGLLWRAIASWLLLGVGWAMMHEFTNSYLNSAKSDQPSLGDWGLSFFSWFVLGGLPFIAGTLLLWFTCGFIFRTAASGHQQVARWGVSGTSELSSTFLIFSFSFLIGGLPLLFLPLLITPFRFLARSTVAVGRLVQPLTVRDCFGRRISDHQGRCKSMEIVLRFHPHPGCPVPGSRRVVNDSCFPAVWIFSLAGMAMFVPLTIAFAAVTGWHCGRIIQSLEKQV